jgi:molybdenum cofactor cytidylyltransferase
VTRGARARDPHLAVARARRYHPVVSDIDCIVAAAGRSERMGRWKPAIPFRGSTLAETVVVAALEACRRVILVTGYRGDELVAMLASEPRVVVVHNPSWELGMFSSIRAGVAAVSTTRFFIQLADMPFVEPTVYRALLAVPDADFVFPVHARTRGHPVLLGPRAREAVLAADAATGSMKEIARRLSVVEVPWSDDSVLRDVDTPTDLADG